MSQKASYPSKLRKSWRFSKATMDVAFKIDVMSGVGYLFLLKLFANNKKLRSDTIENK